MELMLNRVRRIKNASWFHFLILVSVLALFEFSACAEKFKRAPVDGEDAVCYDITAEGKIVRLDYAQQKMSVVCAVPLKGSSPDVMIFGAMAPDDTTAWLFFQRFNSSKGSLYHLNIGTQALRAAGYTVDIAGDLATIEATSLSLYCAVTPSEPATVIEQKPDTFSRRVLQFGFDGWRIFSVAPNGTLYLRPSGYAPDYLVIHADDGKLIRRDQAEVSWPRRDISRVGISNTCENFGLIGCLTPDGKPSWALMNLEVRETLVVIPDIPIGQVQSYLCRLNSATLAIDNVCGTMNSTSKEFDYSGLVKRYVIDVDKKSFSGPVELHYDPSSEVMLRVGPDLKPLPRYRFGYVSMSDFARGIRSDTPLKTWDDRARLIDSLLSASRGRGTP
jgi:hypothetical protein